MEPATPQKSLQQDVNRLGFLMFAAIAIVNFVVALMMQVALDVTTYVIISIVMLVLLMIVIVRLFLVYKAHNLKRPALAVITALTTSALIVGIVAGGAQLLVTLLNLGNDAGLVIALTSTFPPVTIIVAILIYVALLNLILSIVPGKFIPSLKYFKPDTSVVTLPPTPELHSTS